MTADDVFRLVLLDIGPNWQSETVNGMALRDVILRSPMKILVVDAYGSREQKSAWLVLSEHPGALEGMAVIYDDSLQKFGLVEYDTDGRLYTMGLHPTLIEAVMAM